MTWKSSIEIDEILLNIPALEEVKKAFCLSNIALNAVYPECFIANNEWTKFIVPTESGETLLHAAGGSPVSYLALLACFFHHDLLIDCTASNLDAICQHLSASLLNRTILLPHVTGRELYDKFNDEFASNRTDHLDPPEVDRLLQDMPTGVYQVGTLVTGPLGILRSKEVRWMPPSSHAPLWHCSDTGCSALHQVMLRSGHQDFQDACETIEREALRTFGPASEWGYPLRRYLMRSDDLGKEILYTNILPFIASCVVGKDRKMLFLAALQSNSRHHIREQIEGILHARKTKNLSAENLSNELTAEEQLQSLALISTRELVTLIDRLVGEREIRVQPEELRMAPFNPPKTSRHDLLTEMSSSGLRSPGRRPLVRLLTTILLTYRDSGAIDDLRWRIAAPESMATGAALSDYIRREGSMETVRNLIVPERSVFDKIADLVFLQRFPDELPDQFLLRLLWKLGFNLPRYATAISSLHRRLEEFNQCLLGLGTADSEEDREQIRRSGVNVFVSLEDFLERLVSYNLWLCSSDHLVDTRFVYSRDEAVKRVPQILGTSVRSGDATFSWNPNGENTIGTIHTYLQKLLDWLQQRQSADKNAYRRPDEEFPHYALYPDQVFAFSHREAWADFDQVEFEIYSDKLNGILEQINKSNIAVIRNGIDHKRSPEKFPSVDLMLAMVSRLREAVETADIHRLIPKRFWLEEQILDRYGRGTLLFRDYAQRPYSLPMPIPVVSMPEIQFDAPVIIGPGSFLADGAVPIVLSVRSSGEYARYWAGYPRRRKIPPPKSEIGSEQSDDGDGA